MGRKKKEFHQVNLSEAEPTQCKSATVKHPNEVSLLHPSGHEKAGDVVSVNSPRL